MLCNYERDLTQARHTFATFA